MKNIIVLGAGMVGSAIAIDLSKTHNVSLTDLNQDALIKASQKCSNLETFLLDVTKKLILQKRQYETFHKQDHKTAKNNYEFSSLELTPDV